jgi:rod shape determining protein RodA
VTLTSMMIGFGLVQAVRVHRYSEVTSGKGSVL